MIRRVNHTNTKCCICESSESYIKYIDSDTKKPVYLWYKRYEEDGSWLNNAYMCNKCWNKISPNSFDNIQKSLRDKRIKKYKYNKSNSCDRCGEKLEDRVQKEYDDKGYWTKKWLCNKCAKHDDNKERFIKDHKIGNLDPYSTSGKGYISETIVCRTRGIKSLNIENDNWKFPIDHIDSELGILQTKCALYNSVLKNWHNGSLINEYDKDFDHIIFLCFDEYMKNILRVYIIPKFELDGESTIVIYLDWSKVGRGGSRFEKLEKYRVDNNFYNNAYHNLDDNDLKGIRNIKLFLESIKE